MIPTANQMPPTVFARFRQDGIFQKLRLSAGLLCDHRELPEAGKVHSHEREKRSEVEQFASVLISAANVVQQHGSGKRDPSNQQNVVCRRAAARLQISEKLAR